MDENERISEIIRYLESFFNECEINDETVKRKFAKVVNRSKEIIDYLDAKDKNKGK